ncbi:adenosine kinase [Sansalvadorimonas verongulae]|uniref:adenosine kinase n=1 Tax=Sansalvadorimonas verongulae TaxID=2172824 RepID=UPI0012BBAEAA|nr:adenosine kinase [Sansalvadorimonas verongulae]MTI13999.1 adenosine kinase [Sansalvadorimonas verongulae]
MQKHDTKNYHIYGIGAALVDTEIEVDDAFLEENGVQKGMMTLVDTSRRNELITALENHLVYSSRACGGSGGNSAIAASYFGSRVFYSGRVADDDNGQFYIEDMKRAGVTTCQQHNNQGITGKCLVLVTPDAERSMNTFLGISETFSVQELDKEAIKASEYLYIEGYLVTSDCCRAAAVEAHRIATASGVKTSLSLSDPGMVQFFREGLEEMIGDGVDLLFCNKNEALKWAQTDDLDAAIESLKKITKTFAVTLGKRGALVFDGSELIKIDPYPVDKVVDTNGAGDMFAGAFLHGLTAGHGFKKAGELASMASAYIVSSYGPRLAPEKYEEILKTVIK